MRIVEHSDPDRHKLLRVEAEGCVVNIVIGLHDQAGTRCTSIEIIPDEPADDGAIWATKADFSTVMVRRDGPQLLSSEKPPA